MFKQTCYTIIYCYKNEHLLPSELGNLIKVALVNRCEKVKLHERCEYPNSCNLKMLRSVPSFHRIQSKLQSVTKSREIKISIITQLKVPETEMQKDPKKISIKDNNNSRGYTLRFYFYFYPSEIFNLILSPIGPLLLYFLFNYKIYTL